MFRNAVRCVRAPPRSGGIRHSTVKEQQVRLQGSTPGAALHCKQYVWICFCAMHGGCETDRQFGCLYTKYSGSEEWFAVLPEAGDKGDLDEFGEEYWLPC